jgi:hypothetical protein
MRLVARHENQFQIKAFGHERESLLVKYLSASYGAVKIDKCFEIRTMVCQVGAKWSAFRLFG